MSRFSILFLLFLTLSVSLFGPVALPTCSNAAIQLSPDYAYAIGSATFIDLDGTPEAHSLYRWLVNGTPLAANAYLEEGLLLNFENTLMGGNGEAPTAAELNGGAIQSPAKWPPAYSAYAPGKWGLALNLADADRLAYPRQNNLDLSEGTIEMWVALRSPGSDPVYAGRWHVLFYYQAANGDDLLIALDHTSGILYGGGTVDGQWQSAYGSRANTRPWLAGDWHHIALVYSAAGNLMRFYVDGMLAADTNEGHYWAPAASGADFQIGSAPWGDVAYAWIDALHISGVVASSAEIAARSSRPDAPLPNESWLSTVQLTPGNSLLFEYTPSSNGEQGLPCSSPARLYPGIPLLSPQPSSTLLAPGSTSLDFDLETIIPTACAYALGQPLPYASMIPFDQGAGTRHHQTTVSGIDPDPSVLNLLYVRCASHPDYLMSQFYRVRGSVNPGYPRTGNLWGWWNFLDKGLEYIARIDLWLGADFPPDMVRQLRQINPDILILTSINAVENSGLPDDYYLKDIEGNRIEVWPGSYRLNLTKTYVAEYQAQFAYQQMLAGEMMYDGVFFDNVMTTQSWLTEDIYGNPVQIDADEDGIEDDPGIFDAAWKAGVFHEIQTFRQLMPHAIANGHSLDVYEPGITDLFNGISIGFSTADVIEGEMPFSDLWERYQAWISNAIQPPITMFEASPPDQIAYGYDYEPGLKIPPSTLEFARTLFPYMRFGLALTLMNDGYFAYEYGDTWHGNDWWYDELDFDLGYPLGPAQRVNIQGFDPGPNQITNPSFESPLQEPWSFWADTAEGYAASVVQDTASAAHGSASACIEIIAAAGVEWRIEFAQYGRTLEQDVRYDLTFWAKSSHPRSITLSAQKDSPPWSNYGLWQPLQITTAWQEFTIPFQATASASDARIQFLLGETTGTVWIDNVRLTRHPPDVWQREYTYGLALLNGDVQPRTVALQTDWLRLSGSQAPRFEIILDDAQPGFATTGSWSTPTYDSGEWKAAGPFYHDWGETVHQLTGFSGTASWNLSLPFTDVYTVTAWWPAAPQAAGWNSAALYQVLANGQVIASVTLDQRSGGDQWHTIATLNLNPASNPAVRLVCTGPAPCIADALHLRSSARYNDASLLRSIQLQPFDGIILRRMLGRIYLPLLQR